MRFTSNKSAVSAPNKNMAFMIAVLAMLALHLTAFDAQAAGNGIVVQVRFARLTIAEVNAAANAYLDSLQKAKNFIRLDHMALAYARQNITTLEEVIRISASVTDVEESEAQKPATEAVPS